MINLSMKTRLSFDILEDRTTPAVLTSPYSVEYQDIDGDAAEVIFSKPILNQNNVDQVFQFNTESVNGSTVTPQQLQAIYLWRINASELRDIGITIRRKEGTNVVGNGRVDVGGINGYVVSSSFDFIDIDGDLGFLSLGTAQGPTKALKQLHVYSLGSNPSSQGGVFDVNGHTKQIRSIDFLGDVDRIVVDQSVNEASIRAFVYNGDYSAKIGNLTIAGDLIGSTITAASITNLDVQGNIYGLREHDNSITAGVIKKISVGGSIYVSERDRTSNDNTYFKILNADVFQVNGGIVNPYYDGIIEITAKQVYIVGHVDSGYRAATHFEVVSPYLNDKSYSNFTVMGNLYASVSIRSNIGRFIVKGDADLEKTAGLNFISAAEGTDIRSIEIYGNIYTHRQSTYFFAPAVVNSLGKVGLFKAYSGISDFQSNSSFYDQTNFYFNRVYSIEVRGNADHCYFLCNELGQLNIQGSMNNGAVSSTGNIGSVLISGDFNFDVPYDVPKEQNMLYGIYSGKNLGSVRIAGDMKSLTFPVGGQIAAGAFQYPTYPDYKLLPYRIGSVTINGDFSFPDGNGTFMDHGQPGIYSSGTIKSITIRRNVINEHIYARGNPNDSSRRAIDDIFIGGNLYNSMIVAGHSSYDYSSGHSAFDGIKSIRIEGFLADSTIAAGVSPNGGDYFYFTQDDFYLDPAISWRKPVATIESIKIGGVRHLNGDLSSFGIIAPRIRKVVIGETRIHLKPGPLNDSLFLLGYMRIREKIRYQFRT